MLVLISAYAAITRLNFSSARNPGNVLDEFNQVKVYFNGGVNNSSGRNLSSDGYKIGVKYQCVEFVKRYYFERFGHRMPDSMGNAREFFDRSVPDGAMNAKRGLLQFSNGSPVAPESEDILVFGPWVFNPYGHVAIVTAVNATSLEVIQQNPGPFGGSRETIPLSQTITGWKVQNGRVMGWLRLTEDERLRTKILTGHS